MNDEQLMERSRKNLAAFEEIKGEQARFQEEYARLRQEAADLGLDFSGELPLGDLNPEQRSHLRDLEVRAQREIQEIMDDDLSAKPSFKAGRVMV